PNSRWKWPLAIATALLVAWWGYRWLHPAYTPPFQPDPNAYSDLVTLGGQITERTGFYDEMPERELAAIVSINARVLARARVAMRRDSVVALQWDADQQWYGEVHRPRIAALKQL